MKGRILVIDDDAGVRVTVEHVLSVSGYELASASDFKEAKRLFEEFKPDLVITDIIMPGQDGLTTIVRFKKAQPAVKVIAMSGGARLGNDNILQKAQEVGADHILAKPFATEQLTSLVSQSLEGA